MLAICNTREALALEKEAISKQKISVEELMGAAGRAVAAEVMLLNPSGPVTIVCGKGNNGGDGFVAARYLNKNNIAVKVLTLYEENTFSKEAFKAYEMLPQALIEKAEKSLASLKKAEIVVDCIFGFSFKPPVRDLEAGIIKLINKQRTYVIAVDLPSGLEASTGYAQEGKVIEAAQTICFSCIKKGLLTSMGPVFGGKIKVADIGIRPQIINKHKTAQALDLNDAKALLPERKVLTHKKAAGKVLIIGGSADYTGAPVMTAQAALRSGAGFVTLAVPELIKPIIQQKTTEIVIEGFGQKSFGVLTSEDLKRLLEISGDYDSVAIGPGLGTDKETVKLITSFLRKVDKPVVADADALNALGQRRDLPASAWLRQAGARDERRGNFLSEIKTKIVLTPHAGELARLTGLSVEEIEIDRFKAAGLLSSANITVVLKGRYSVIATNKELFVNLTSNPGMATAGTGDVLTGIIVSLIARGLNFDKAAYLGTYLHGLAGDIAAVELSEHSLIATDLIDYLPDAFKAVERG